MKKQTDGFVVVVRQRGLNNIILLNKNMVMFCKLLHVSYLAQNMILSVTYGS